MSLMQVSQRLIAQLRHAQAVHAPLSVYNPKSYGRRDGRADPLQPEGHCAVMLMGDLVGSVATVHIILVHAIWMLRLDVLTQQHPLVPMQHLHHTTRSTSCAYTLTASLAADQLYPIWLKLMQQ